MPIASVATRTLKPESALLNRAACSTRVAVVAGREKEEQWEEREVGVREHLLMKVRTEQCKHVPYFLEYKATT